MIAVVRPMKPAFLDSPDNKWTVETQKAIAHYSTGGVLKAFDFAAYRDDQLKAELKKVFMKCAYCDSTYAHVYDGDIEHFRPKGKVNEKKPKIPGYYWLANDWDNLLLSCQHCNQSRRHILDGETTATSRGKLDQFPLSDESKRVCSPEKSLKSEEKYRLLLNPCIDKPEKHFGYEITSAVMIPLTKMGVTSLEVYVLQRPELVKRRHKHLLLILRQIGRVKHELDEYAINQSAAQKSYLDAELNDLLTFAADTSDFAGMARFFVKKFLKDNKLA